MKIIADTTSVAKRIVIESVERDERMSCVEDNPSGCLPQSDNDHWRISLRDQAI